MYKDIFLSACLLTILLLFGHVLPVAAGHIVELLAWVEAFTDADGLEICAPKVLKEAVIGAQDIVVEFSA